MKDSPDMPEIDLLTIEVLRAEVQRLKAENAQLRATSRLVHCTCCDVPLQECAQLKSQGELVHEITS